ncbi:hypothetical protein [Longimicrobium sp.]|uniref:hypothetical protein n=1 Tax=Longimicrobium sp. TaxID=2029185 RepID=UPI002BD282A2|nr:hypothetical protein [Longimicrobium sp.]HSU16880.1 hypothetical protein [Longimicrobium sp.]
MPTYAEFAEALAKSLHQGAGMDNQSTTTTCYNELNHTLYITHQGNKTYLEVLQPAQTLKLRFGTQHIADIPLNPTPGQTPRPKSYGIPGAMKKVERHLKLDGWLRSAADFLDDTTGLEDFIQGIHAVKVVLNQDLFVTTSVSTSGFHGESRIIRYHFVKFIRNFQPVDFEKLDPLKADKLIEELENGFIARYANRLHFGSSQGACKYCARYMKKLGLKFGSKQTLNKDREETWLNPVTMTSSATGFRYHSYGSVRVDRTGAQVREWRQPQDEDMDDL